MASDSVVAEISETVSCISWAPGKDLLIAGSWDSSVYLYDIPEQASYVFFFFFFYSSSYSVAVDNTHATRARSAGERA